MYDLLPTSIAIEIKLSTKRRLRKSTTTDGTEANKHLSAAGYNDFIDAVLQKCADDLLKCGSTRHGIVSTFEPIASAPGQAETEPTVTHYSDFDGPFRHTVEELAPYVRSIVSFDCFLEKQRQQLSNLLSQGGRKAKRMRSTRASRSAIEGGNRAAKRREKWFDSNLNYELVLQTAGRGWS